ncbi:MAG: hypothetical protein HWE34_17645 [Methylocystaceae bacterium]|nr:hypothetical protein [Methylocystaceae bacterium]
MKNQSAIQRVDLSCLPEDEFLYGSVLTSIRDSISQEPVATPLYKVFVEAGTSTVSVGSAGKVACFERDVDHYMFKTVLNKVFVTERATGISSTLVGFEHFSFNELLFDLNELLDI